MCVCVYVIDISQIENYRAAQSFYLMVHENHGGQFDNKNKNRERSREKKNMIFKVYRNCEKISKFRNIYRCIEIDEIGKNKNYFPIIFLSQ